MRSVFPAFPRAVVWLGLALHLTYLLAMFDTFFHSPIVDPAVHHAVPQSPEEEPLAERVVLIVADGLRADLLFTPSGSPRVPLPEGETMAPYLRSIAEQRGAFGLSHTRVPTESRPGHVALIAGLWEDPSAVFKGWKHNPVSFDSVFNHSSTTFAFGSPDILPIFGERPQGQEDDAREAPEGRRVLMWMYDGDEEDFTSDATRLDYFVLERLEALLALGRVDPVVDRRLRARHTMFFLHLLGLDTSGHGYGPHSREYIDNIQVVDGIVERVERLIGEYYEDDRTAFLFTADHGMSNIGNHGDGHPDNTRTPWIGWGAGIRSPTAEDASARTHDDVSSPWGLNHLKRRDVDQVDLTALMAALSGTTWPGNNVGIVPTDVLACEDGGRRAAGLAAGNAWGIMEQFRVKEELKARHRLFFRPFPELSVISDKAAVAASDRVASIRSGIAAGDYATAERESRHLAGLALRGIDFYDTFDQTRLKWIVTAGYTSFAVYALVYIMETYGVTGRSAAPAVTPLGSLDSGMIAITSAVTALFAYEQTPWYCLYASFPLFFIRCLLQYQLSGTRTRKVPRGRDIVISLAGVAGAIGVLFYIATGYNDRRVWTFGFALLALYPFLARNQATIREKVVWIALLAPCSLWATLDVEKQENAATLIYANWLYAATAGLCAYLAWRRTNSSASVPAWLPATLGTMLSMGSLVSRAIWSLQSKEGLSAARQIEAWLQLFASAAGILAIGLKPGQNAFERILLLSFAFAPDFLLLSASWEPFFLYNFAAVLLYWMYLERGGSAGESPDQRNIKERPTAHRAIQPSDVYRGLIFLYLVHAGFFCTGNVASISSFYLAPVYRIVPVFQPAIMSALLMFKIIVPFILLSAAFVSICKIQRLPPFALIMLTLVLSEPICLYFFWKVTTNGSWLEIGSSISHFAIASLLVAYNVFLYLIGEWIMSGTTV